MTTSNDTLPIQQFAKLQQVHSFELMSLFENFVDQIQVLSLDCFDTLLWRTTAVPSDLFYRLEANALFKQHGFTKAIRESGEKLASQLNRVTTGVSQVTLYDIYRTMYPNLSESEIEALVTGELNEEMQVCYAFKPIIELIRAAKKQRKKIIIVSDTYLNKSQFTKLLSSRLPNDVMNAIDKIFCSCQVGAGKSDLLFGHVINDLKVPAQSILHIGDNLRADFQTPKNFGLQAFHFIQQQVVTTEMLRIESVCASFVDTSIRTTRPLYQPFSGLISEKINHGLPESLIGYAALGPVVYAFAKFILREISVLEQAGKKPKVVFLMRDAYLPSLVCETVAGKNVGTNVRISRFAAIASSFRTKADIDRYLAQNISSLRFDDMCSQLLLPKELCVTFIKKAEKSQKPVESFLESLHQNEVIQMIIQHSTEYRGRLKKYLQKEIGLTHGDTILFIDLGYMGTTQIKLAPLFEDEIGIETIGRYLICVHELGVEGDRKGLLDHSYYDCKALGMLVGYISLFEQMCTASSNSTIDFDNEGNPILFNVSVTPEQYGKLNAIQSECLRFARDAEHYTRSHSNISEEMLRDAAAVSLMRFLFLPTQPEIEHLQSFRHDVNLGTSEVLPLFDLQKGLLQLHRRSWLFGLKDNVKHKRMNYPAEWRAANLELSIALMAQHRFCFSVAATDLSLRSEKISAVFSSGNKVFRNDFDALFTHDGFYALIIPIMNDYEIGIQFGKTYQWLEIECADMFELDTLFTKHESQTTHAADEFITAHAMIAKGGNLFECQSESGMLIFVPQALNFQKQMLLRIIFRPTVTREISIA